VRAVVLLALAACTGAAPDDVETVQQESAGTWGDCPKHYPCQPGTPWSVVICDAVCGSDGGYCEPYTWIEEEWCALHPMAVENGLVICDRYGAPTRQTRCLPYVMP
jgi:hypothetical protein